MSWSLQLQKGDLVTSASRLGQVTGGNKLSQDLRCAVLERRGTDPAHRTFGSLIDGGYDDSGNWTESLIGDDDIDYVVAHVDAELRRLAAEHQARQVKRAQEDRYAYGESTLTNNELLGAITAIDFVRAQDKLMVTVHVQTGIGEKFAIDVPVSIPGDL